MTYVPFNKHNRIQAKEDRNVLIGRLKGEKFQKYRELYNSANGGKAQLDFPVDLAFEVIDYCNYACPYCHRAEDHGSGTLMKTETFCLIIDQYVEMNDGMGGIVFGGGEPLIDKTIEDKIEYALKAGVQDVIITTNAVYLTKDRARRLVEMGVTKMHISLDAATQETYSKTRGGDLAQVEQNILDLISIREELNSVTPAIRTSFVVCELNEHEQDAFAEKWRDRVDYVDFQKIRNHALRDKEINFDLTEPFHCPYPSYQLAIGANGDVKPCCNPYGEKLVLANVKDGTHLRDIFHSEMEKKLRKAFSEGSGYPDACIKCRATLPEEFDESPLINPVAGKPLGIGAKG